MTAPAARALLLRPLAPPALRRVAEAHVEQSAKYLDVIARFGRFPLRNQVLARITTPEEAAFMASFVAVPAAVSLQVDFPAAADTPGAQSALGSRGAIAVR